VGKQLIALAGAVLAVVLIVVGCGGSDSSAAPITKAEFVKKADAACEKSHKQSEAELFDFLEKNKLAINKAPSKAQYTELVDKILTPSVEVEIEKIRDLGTPKGDKGEVEAMLDALEEDLEHAQSEPQLVVVNSEKVFANSTKKAKELGLKVCGTR
jgi:hypothetical protein